MARNNGRDQKDHGKRKPPEVKGRVRRGRPKVCQFCVDHVEWVDYKDTAVLRRFMNDRGRIKARRRDRYLRPAPAGCGRGDQDGTGVGIAAVRGPHVCLRQRGSKGLVSQTESC